MNNRAFKQCWARRSALQRTRSPSAPLLMPFTSLLNCTAPSGSCAASASSRWPRDTPRVSFTPPAAADAASHSSRVKLRSILPSARTRSTLQAAAAAAAACRQPSLGPLCEEQQQQARRHKGVTQKCSTGTPASFKVGRVVERA